MSVKASVKKSTPNDISTLASEALAAIQQAANTIPIDHVSPEDAMADRVASRVPDEAMTIAASVLEAHPKRFPDYDAQTIRSALSYEQAMRPVGAQLILLGQQINRSVAKRKGDAATQSLGLYASLKGLSKASKNDPVRDQQRAMQKLLTTHKKTRATTVTAGEVEEAKKGIRKSKVAAAKASIAAEATAAAAEAADVAGNATPTTEGAAPAPSPTASVPVATAPPAVPAPSH